MERKKTLMEYLKESRKKRRKIVRIANEYLEKIMKEEERKVKSRGYSRENHSVLRNKHVLLEPIAEKRQSSRTLVCRNADDLVL